MRSVWMVLALALVLLSGLPEAHAARRVHWSKVDVRAGKDQRRVASVFKKLLKRQSRRAKWGRGGVIRLRARVVELRWEELGDVLRVSVTVVGNIKGGKGVRSHIRIGGRPTKRRALEKQALKIVAEGVVTRLSSIARIASATPR